MSFDKMIVITGGIGSGKTYISNVFKESGIPVFNTDDCAKRIMNEDSRIVSKFKLMFGNDIYISEGVLDRTKLGEAIFKNEENTRFIEGLVHPAVLKEFMDWKFDKFFKGDFPFVMMESAIITKSKTYKLFDYAVLVDAPLDVRRERVLDRTGMTEEMWETVLSKQDDPYYVQQKLESSCIYTHIIYNDGKADIGENVKNIIEFFKNKI